ncbi:hypothetical protein F5888DRAFT_262966 [Russula emetica]|nr:hypothetical protein F5888DRAFT_262966 [Russula emetica]
MSSTVQATSSTDNVRLIIGAMADYTNNESAIISILSSHSSKQLYVLLGLAGAASGIVVGIALAPLVAPTLLSILAVGAVAGKLPPQVDQLVKYHLSPRELLGKLLGTIKVWKIVTEFASAAHWHSIASFSVNHPIATAKVIYKGAKVVRTLTAIAKVARQPRRIT